MRTITCLSLIFLPLLAGAQTPESILESVREKQLERWEGVQSYAVTRSISGMESTTVYQRSEVQTEDGPRTSFVPVTASMRSGGNADSNKIPGGIFGNDANATMDEARAMEDFIANAELVGTETVDGREAFHLRVADAAALDSPGADNFRMDVADVWVDADEYVPLKLSMTGAMLEGGQERPVSIERIQTDYREVAGSNLYESFRQTMTQTVLRAPGLWSSARSRRPVHQSSMGTLSIPVSVRAETLPCSSAILATIARISPNFSTLAGFQSL